MLRADWDAVMPMTGPSPAAAQMRAISARTRVLPDPAGALITDTRRPSVSTASAAAAWSSRSPVPVRCVWRLARVVRASGQRVFEPREVRAERVRGLRAGHARRAARAGLRDHALFHGQLRAGGVAGAAVAPVDAAAVGAQQAGRDLGRLGGFQAEDRLELRAQGPVGQVLQQRGGRGRVPAGAGQDPAQVLDQVRAGPGALLLLRQRERLLRRAGQLELGERRRRPRRRVRGSACARSACQTDGATDASGTPSVRASLSAQPACSCARSSAPVLALRVAKLDACASCASSRWDGARP